MPSERTSDVKFEIGHVLFIDIVGYSKLLISEQSEQIQKLKEIVRGTEQFRLAEEERKLLRLPTGDGGALVFRNSPDAPVLCALEISKVLKKRPDLRVRMGVHSGPVNEVVDLNEQANIAGAGINIAQRVMDCGDAGHILLSKRVAEDLVQYRQWQPLLRDLGEVEVKHGARIHVFNLCNEELGNPEVPEKLRPKEQEASDASARQEEGFWIAVLPFKYVGANADLSALAEGLSEDIVTGLSRFSYLRVIARSSTLRLAKDSGDVRAVGKELGARYVMEGSLRQAGTKLRLAVQVVDTTSGAHLWAENYERAFSPEAIFELQDDLVPRIVSTVADMNGVLPRSLSEAVRSRTPEQLSPYEAVLRSFGYFERVTPEDLAVARAGLELAVQKAPAYADAWAMLALLCVQEHGQGFSLRADCLTSGLSAARRAVETAPSNHLAHFSLAQALFFQKEFQSFRNAAERAVALNPMDGNSIAFLGELLIYAGEWERGLALVERAKQLNRNHPGWYWYADFYNSYRQHDYRGAITFLLKADLPGHWGMHAGLAAAYGQLGETDAAGKALPDLLKLRPDFAFVVRKEMEKWWNLEYVEHFIDGLQKAGLEIPNEAASSTTLRETGSSPSIAVLPFVNISNDPDNDYFCDGLAEELLNALSKIGDLKVAARTSTFSFKGKNVNVGVIGQTLGVKTVLEGSVRHSTDRVRIAVQLVNVADGYQLWSERYDREMKDIFDVQDEISLAVVDALKLKLFGHEKAAVVKRYTDNAEAYQLYLKGGFYANRRTSEGLQKAIEYFNQSISVDPGYALGYAGLADAYLVLSVPDALTGALSPQDSLPKARAAAEKATQIDNSVGETYAALAHVKWKSRDWVGAESDYNRSIRLSPNYPIAHFYYAIYLASLGRQDQAVKEIKRAQELDPLSLPVNAGVIYVLYFGQQYDEAIEAGKKALEMDAASPLTHQRLGLVYVQKQMYREAIAEFELATNNSNGAPLAIISLGHAYAVAGNKVEAQKVLAELKDLSQRRYVSPYGIAIIYAGLGEKEEAFRWLERAGDERNTELTLLKVDPRIDPLRSDPQFTELLEKTGFLK